MQALPAHGQDDVWSYIWGNGQYSVSKAYNHFIGHAHVHPSFKWLSKSCCRMKLKVFFWLLLQNKLNTRGMLQRRHMTLDSYTCELCLLQRVETLRHLFLLCSFPKNCWASIGVLVPSWLRAESATTYMLRSINLPFAMEIIMIMCWCIWTERNAWIFSNEDECSTLQVQF
jgi:hypothetical protein